MRRLPLSREAVFGIVCGVLVVVTLAYVGFAALHPSTPPAAASVTPATDPGLAALLRQPHLVFLVPSGADPTQDVVSVAPLQQGTQVRFETGLRCQRAYFAAGHGICVGRDMLGGGFLFDDRFVAGRPFTQPGLTSRARVSPDGRFAASTVFVTGHSYNSPGFSTNTLITDVATGATVDMERFTIRKDGQRIQAPDFNFWGVTFAADGNRFYATLGTNGHTYLLEGDRSARTARVIADGVECPSLSPDGTRIAYKHAVPGDQRRWRLHVLDLRTLADTTLAETRSVDDQAEWLDGARITYGLQDEGPPPTLDVNLWTVPADGSGAPALYLAHAASPAVVRT
jgi:WD40-like Beta Propeller Repeat